MSRFSSRGDSTIAERSPHLTELQATRSRGSFPPVPAVCAVTGGTGFVGARLVEMLVERGAQEVRVLDVVPPPETAWRHKRVRCVGATRATRGRRRLRGHRRPAARDASP